MIDLEVISARLETLRSEILAAGGDMTYEVTDDDGHVVLAYPAEAAAER